MDAPNPLHPDRMTPAERRDELCSILARGLLRLRVREREPEREVSASHGEIRLHNSADRRLHANRKRRRQA